MSQQKRVAITGVGTSEFARAIPEKSTIRLQVEAAAAAITDAGLTKDQIDGVLCGEGGGTAGNPRNAIEFSELMGIFSKTVCSAIPMGGATSGFCLDVARWAIENGRCRNVLIVAGGKESGAGRSSTGHGFADHLSTWPGHSVNYEHPFGPLMISFYAALAQRHMHEFGTTSEQLASVSVAFRKHASLNPDAVYRHLISIDDVMNSRMISSPLHLLDCCMINDGAVAFVVSSADVARNIPQKPVWVIGSGGGHSSYFMGSLCTGVPGDESEEFDLVRTTARVAADAAFGEAGVERGDIDFVTLTDNFSISPIVLLEDFGFCQKGEGGPFVEGGRIEIGGVLPVNPHGGLLSCNHAATNFQNFVEATRQLRGDCGERQVVGAKLAVAASTAGVNSTHQVSVLAIE